MSFLKKSTIAIALLAITAGALPVYAGPNADAAKVLPKDCWGYAVIRSVSAIDEKIQLLQQMGLPIPPGTQLAPMLQGPMFNLGDSVDTTRPICIVMLDMKKFGRISDDSPEDPGNAAVMFIPAKDAKAVIEKLAKPDTSGSIRPCMLMGQEAFGGVQDGYAVISKSEKSVKSVLAESGEKMELVEAQAAVLDKCDLYVSASVNSVWGSYKQMALPMMQMVFAAQDPSGEQARAIEKTFDELAKLDIGLSLGEAGVSIHGVMVPKKESDLSKLFADGKNTDKSLLTLMPKEKFLAAMSVTTPYSEHQEKFGGQGGIAQAIKALQMQGGTGEIDEAAVKAIDAELKKLTRAIEEAGFGASALDGGDAGYFGTHAILKTNDPKACVESMRTVYAKMWQVSNDEDLKKAKSFLAHTPDAETVEGGKVDTIVIKTKELAEDAEMSPDDMKLFKALFGTDVAVRFGAVGDKHVLITFGGGQARYAKAAKLIKDGGDGLTTDTGIQDAMKKLTSPRAAEGYLSVENIMRLVKDVSKQMGEEDLIPFEVPEMNAPAAMDTAMVGSAWQFDLYIPMKLINGIKKSIDEQQKREMEAFDEDDGGGFEEDGGMDGGDDDAGSDDDM